MSVSPSLATPDRDPAERAPRRVRHEPRRRELEVKHVDKIAAHMIRVTLGGDLEGFTSLGFDDHIKLFFPAAPPAPGAEPQALARDYTPRRYDPAAQYPGNRLRDSRRRSGDALGRNRCGPAIL